MKGKLIVVEGIGGVGKSTIKNKIVEWLEASGLDSMYTREPGGTPAAEILREYCRKGITSGGEVIELEPMTIALLFNAARAENLGKVILPALREGKVVLTDRFADSTFAYQSQVNGIDLATLQGIHQLAHGVYPDLTFLLDAPALVAQTRICEWEHANDQFDRVGIETQEKVRRQYLELTRVYPEKYVVVDATQSPDQVFAQILPHLENLRNVMWGRPTPHTASIKVPTHLDGSKTAVGVLKV